MAMTKSLLTYENVNIVWGRQSWLFILKIYVIIIVLSHCVFFYKCLDSAQARLVVSDVRKCTVLKVSFLRLCLIFFITAIILLHFFCRVADDLKIVLLFLFLTLFAFRYVILISDFRLDSYFIGRHRLGKLPLMLFLLYCQPLLSISSIRVIQ